MLYVFPEFGIFGLNFHNADLRQNLWIVVWEFKDQFDEVLAILERPNADLES